MNYASPFAASSTNLAEQQPLSGGPLYAIGDIHGDLDALLRILTGLELVDLKGHWCGADARVVLIGDLNDRGPDSFAVVHNVMGWEAEAAASGGLLTSLLGNHELLAAEGNLSFVRPSELLEMESFWLGERQGLHGVFRGPSVWASWIAARPTVLECDGYLLRHAGLGRWATEWSLDSLNATMRHGVRHLQGAETCPPGDAWTWLSGEHPDSPVWTTRFTARLNAPAIEAQEKQDLQTTLAHFDAHTLVVGHRPTKTLDFGVAAPHPNWGDLVVGIDTAISGAIGGRLSAVRLTDSGPVPAYFDRGSTRLGLTHKLRANALAALALAASPGLSCRDARAGLEGCAWPRTAPSAAPA